MNVVTLTGNLTRDPELKKTVNDSSIAKIGIAVKRDRKEENGEYLADFFDLVAWNSQADYIAKYLRKGDKVCVTGSIHIREWTDRDQCKRRSVEINVNSIENLSPKSDDSRQDAAQAPQQDASAKKLDEIEITDDDLPF